MYQYLLLSESDPTQTRRMGDSWVGEGGWGGHNRKRDKVGEAIRKHKPGDTQWSRDPCGSGEASRTQEGNVSQQVDTDCWMCCCGTAARDNVTRRLPGLKGRETETEADCTVGVFSLRYSRPVPVG